MESMVPHTLRINVILRGVEPDTMDVGDGALVGSGRAADVRVADTELAPVHIRLSRDGDDVIVIPLAAGVVVDGKAVPVDEVHRAPGCRIDIGHVCIVATPRIASDPQRTESLARELMRELLGLDEDSPPELVVEGGPATGQRRAISLVEPRVIIGRGETATWILLDPDLSRNHAAIERRDEGVRVYDLRSKNGTKVNGRPVGITPPGVLLTDGAILTMGDSRVRFVNPVAAMVADHEAHVEAIARGVPGQITQTTPGSGRAREAVGATGRGAAVLESRSRLAIAIVASIAVVAFVLLVALLASS
jgi:hypothetical protein